MESIGSSGTTKGMGSPLASGSASTITSSSNHSRSDESANRFPNLTPSASTQSKVPESSMTGATSSIGQTMQHQANGKPTETSTQPVVEANNGSSIKRTAGVQDGGHGQTIPKRFKAQEEHEALKSGQHLHLEDARLQSLRVPTAPESEPSSPSSSRQSSPSVQSNAGPEAGYGGAKRRGADVRKTLPRNIDRVYFGDYDIKTWYHSPYPLEDDHASSSSHAHAGPSSSTAASSGPNSRTTSISKTKIRIRNGSSAAGTNGSHQDTASPSAAGTDDQPKKTAATASTSAAPSSNNATIASPSCSMLPPSSIPNNTTTVAPKVPALWICEGCLKYMRTYIGWYSHKKDCPHKHPPGQKVYQRGSHTVWQVDGATSKLYCQNLSLFGKLFIDHKTIFFDVEPFLFYVVTDCSGNFDYVLGFFSKEKVSYDDYNLACIITFPPFQKKGFGTLMIELSYHLSARAGIAGTPERPLSELGFKGYLSYWSSILLRTLGTAFNLGDEDATIQALLLPAGMPTATTSSKPTAATVAAANRKTLQRACLHARATLLGIESTASTSDGKNRDEWTEEEKMEWKKARRATLGCGKEAAPSMLASSPPRTRDVPSRGAAASSSMLSSDLSSPGQPLSSPSKMASSPPSSSAASSPVKPSTLPDHPALNIVSGENGMTNTTDFRLETTLERLARATNLRVEDVAFALSECGLLKYRLRREVTRDVKVEGVDKVEKAEQQQQGPLILISKEAVKKALLERKIRRAVLDLQYIVT